MCRNIKTLANFAPPATEDEIRASALQFVRKLSGANRPSRANQAAFNRAVDEVTAAARRLIGSRRPLHRRAIGTKRLERLENGRASVSSSRSARLSSSPSPRHRRSGCSGTPCTGTRAGHRVGLRRTTVALLKCPWLRWHVCQDVPGNAEVWREPACLRRLAEGGPERRGKPSVRLPASYHARQSFHDRPDVAEPGSARRGRRGRGARDPRRHAADHQQPSR